MFPLAFWHLVWRFYLPETRQKRLLSCWLTTPAPSNLQHRSPSSQLCVEAANHKIVVKGGKFLESYALADTLVFDKTGTLTVASPSVSEVIPFPPYNRTEVLKTSACLEEHFPHSVAHAIVHKAEQENLKHREEHAEVEYVVAHGIRSKLHGKKALIGSYHFIVEDEGIPVTPEQKSIIEEKGHGKSAIFLALGDTLAGMICIDDPLRPEAAETITSTPRIWHKENYHAHWRQ